MKKYLQHKWEKNRADITIIVSGKVDFNNRKKDKGGHYIMIKCSIQQEDVTILNIYALNIRKSQFIKDRLLDLQVELQSHTIVVNFNTTQTALDRSLRQKTNREILNLN